jgi:cytochrome bd-type quinol oxidase subunit 2
MKFMRLNKRGNAVSVLSVAAWVIVVVSFVMIVLHSGVVFMLKRQGAIDTKHTYRSERTVGTVVWLLLIIATLMVMNFPANDTFRGSAMLIAVVFLGWIGGLMFSDDLSLFRRIERERMREMQGRIQRPTTTS